MIAVDTNILVYAHRKDSPWHELAYASVQSLAEGKAQWAIAWHSLSEFFSAVTHRRFYGPPTPPDRAIAQIEKWLASPGLVVLAESQTHWPTLAALIRAAKLTGPSVYDARIAAVCIDHGISELWTADRDFSRFPALKTRNPLVS